MCSSAAEERISKRTPEFGQEFLGLAMLPPRPCVTDDQYSYNRLALGDAGNGDPTPIQKRKNLYFVTLEGMSIGEESIGIDPHVFSDGGVILDSGAALTSIPLSEYNILKQGVHEVVGWKLTRYFRREEDINLLCYGGNVTEEMTGFPGVSFHFAGGADLAMDEKSMFLQANSDHFCMSVRPLKDGRKISVIGIMAQQNYNVGFDLEAGMVHLQKIDTDIFL
ncbi:aspartyl protease UND-like [Tripterygium wilfordii]|uniref:aspartyl protease UND-like n=1 Tax=Tripterygium wilfordii TaxID=458696 RepID=UPI0018F84A46|nr:aspartyl protease UND-like [Tripterygium wilfordii]